MYNSNLRGPRRERSQFVEYQRLFSTSQINFDLNE